MPTVRATATAAAYWGSTGQSLACNKPAGTVQNDILYAAVTDCRSDDSLTPPSGWSKIAFSSGVGGTGSWNRLTIFRKVAGGSEPASYTFTGLADAAVIGIVAVQDAHTTNLEGAIQAAWDSTLDYNWNTPSVDPVDSNELLLSFAANECTDVTSYSATPPSGVTEIVDLNSPTNTWAHLHIGYQNLNSGDPTGAKTWVQSNQGGTTYYDRNMGINITVRPSAAAPVTIDASVGTLASSAPLSGSVETANAAIGVLASGSTRHTVAEGMLTAIPAFGLEGLAAVVNEAVVLDAGLAVLQSETLLWGFDQGFVIDQIGTFGFEGLAAGINEAVIVDASVGTMGLDHFNAGMGSEDVIDAAFATLSSASPGQAVQQDFTVPAALAVLASSRPQAQILVSTVIAAKVAAMGAVGQVAPPILSALVEPNVGALSLRGLRAYLPVLGGDLKLQASIREAYASAPPGIVTLETIEMRHAAFTQPIRVVRNYENVTARLEADAPLNGGQDVLFTAFAFELRLPEVNPTGRAELELVIDNVDQIIVQNIELAMVEDTQIEVTYRPYLSTDLTTPQMIPPLNLYVKSIEVTAERVKAICDFGEVMNRRFPYDEYTLGRFPALING